MKKINPVIYKITCLVNGKVYIGSAKDFETRKKSHLACLRNNNSNSHKLQRAYNKYGQQNMVFEIIEHVLLLEDLFLREKFWIKKFDSVDSGMNICYDTLAPMLGRKHKEQTKQLIREKSSKQKHSEKTKQLISLLKTGIKRGALSDETKEKIRQKKLGNKNGFFGKKHTEETKLKIKKSWIGRSSWRKGKKGLFSEETIRKISEAQKKRRALERLKNKQK